MTTMNALRLMTLLCMIILVSCTNEERYDEIIGEWHATEWLVEGEPSNRNLENVHFQFNENKTFYSRLGAVEETGTYKLKGDYLYTNTPERLEIMVRMSKLTADTLVFDMNNSGVDETLVLLKKNE